jgi:hypothetical protein
VLRWSDATLGLVIVSYILVEDYEIH